MSQKVIGPQFGLDQGPSFKSNQVLGLEFNFGMDMIRVRLQVRIRIANSG